MHGVGLSLEPVLLHWIHFREFGAVDETHQGRDLLVQFDLFLEHAELVRRELFGRCQLTVDAVAGGGQEKAQQLPHLALYLLERVTLPKCLVVVGGIHTGRFLHDGKAVAELGQHDAMVAHAGALVAQDKGVHHFRGDAGRVVPLQQIGGLENLLGAPARVAVRVFHGVARGAVLVLRPGQNLLGANIVFRHAYSS